jgi:hypothetical protein
MFIQHLDFYVTVKIKACFWFSFFWVKTCFYWCFIRCNKFLRFRI